MKKLTILVPAGQHNLSSVIGPYKFFLKANDHFKSRGLQPVFDVQLAGVSKQEELYDGLFAIRPHTNIQSVEHTHLIIVPGLAHRNLAEVVEANKEAVDWLQYQYHRGAAIASICTGAFLLAATGLLNGRTCSTHWNAAAVFRQLFPAVNLQPERIITDERGLYTNGGEFSFLNLMLYLVEKYYDRETAIFCAKVFQVDIGRNSQLPFVIFDAQKEHADEMIRKAQDFIEENLIDKFSMEELASKFAVSRRNFDRRFIQATGNTPTEYQQKLRVEQAKKMLETGRRSVAEVMYEVGYSDIKAFRTVFRKFTGLTPLDYRVKHNKNYHSQLIRGLSDQFKAILDNEGKLHHR